MANRRRKDLTDIEKAREFGRQSLEDAESGKLQRAFSENAVRGIAEIPFLDGSVGWIQPDNTSSVAVGNSIPTIIPGTDRTVQPIGGNRDISYEMERMAREAEQQKYANLTTRDLERLNKIDEDMRRLASKEAGNRASGGMNARRISGLSSERNRLLGQNLSQNRQDQSAVMDKWLDKDYKMTDSELEQAKQIIRDYENTEYKNSNIYNLIDEEQSRQSQINALRDKVSKSSAAEYGALNATVNPLLVAGDNDYYGWTADDLRDEVSRQKDITSKLSPEVKTEVGRLQSEIQDLQNRLNSRNTVYSTGDAGVDEVTGATTTYRNAAELRSDIEDKQKQMYKLMLEGAKEDNTPDYDSYSLRKANAQKQNPVEYTTSDLATRMIESAAIQGAVGSNGFAADMLVDALTDTLPEYAANRASGMSRKDAGNQALASGALNTLMNGGAYVASNLDNIIPYLRNSARNADIDPVEYARRSAEESGILNADIDNLAKQNEIDPAELVKQNEIDVNAKVDNVNQAVDEVNNLAEQIPNSDNLLQFKESLVSQRENILNQINTSNLYKHQRNNALNALNSIESALDKAESWFHTSAESLDNVKDYIHFYIDQMEKNGVSVDDAFIKNVDDYLDEVKAIKFGGENIPGAGAGNALDVPTQAGTDSAKGMDGKLTDEEVEALQRGMEQSAAEETAMNEAIASAADNSAPANRELENRIRQQVKELEMSRETRASVKKSMKNMDDLLDRIDNAQSVEELNALMDEAERIGRDTDKLLKEGAQSRLIGKGQFDEDTRSFVNAINGTTIKVPDNMRGEFPNQTLKQLQQRLHFYGDGKNYGATLRKGSGTPIESLFEDIDNATGRALSGFMESQGYNIDSPEGQLKALIEYADALKTNQSSGKVMDYNGGIFDEWEQEMVARSQKKYGELMGLNKQSELPTTPQSVGEPTPAMGQNTSYVPPVDSSGAEPPENGDYVSTFRTHNEENFNLTDEELNNKYFNTDNKNFHFIKGDRGVDAENAAKHLENDYDGAVSSILEKPVDTQLSPQEVDEGFMAWNNEVQKARETGDYSKSAQIMYRMTQDAHDKGAGLQAYVAWKKHSPAGVVLDANTTVRTMAESVSGKEYIKDLDSLAEQVAKISSSDLSFEEQVEQVSKLMRELQSKGYKNGVDGFAQMRELLASGKPVDTLSVKDALYEANKLPNLSAKSQVEIAHLAEEMYGKDLTAREKQRYINQINMILSREKNWTIKDKAIEMMHMLMLSGTRTHIRNFLANVGMLPQEALARKVSAIGQNAYRFLKDPNYKPTQAFHVGKDARQLATQAFEKIGGAQGVVEGVADKYTNRLADAIGANYMFGTGKGNVLSKANDFATDNIPVLKKLEDSLSEFAGKGLKKMGAENAYAGMDSDISLLENYRQFIYGSLSGLEDDPFVKRNFEDRLASYIQAQGIKNLDEIPDAAYDIARAEALKATFKDDNTITEVFKKIKQMPVVGETVLPFVKTPANLLARSIDFSPIGLARDIYGAINKNSRFAKNTVGETIDAISKGIGGSATGLAAMWLYSKGVLTGKQSDNVDMANYMANEGWQPYSVSSKGVANLIKEYLNVDLDLGDSFYPFDWMQPITTDVIAAQELWDELMDGKKITDKTIDDIYNRVKSVGGSYVDSLLEQSTMQNIAKLFESNYNDEGAGSNLIDSIIQMPTRYTSGAINDITKLTDDTKREYYSKDKPADTLKNMFMSKIPVLSQKLPAKYDIFGNEMTRNDSDAGKWFNTLVSPGTTTHMSDDANYRYVDSLNETIRQSNIRKGLDEDAGIYVPTKTNRSIKLSDDTKYALDNVEYSEASRISGETRNKLLNLAQKNDIYNSLSAENKVKMLDMLDSVAVSNGYTSVNPKAKISDDKTAELLSMYKEGDVENLIKQAAEDTEAKYNEYGLSADAYKEMKANNEDFSQFKGFGEALDAAGLEYSAGARDAWLDGQKTGQGAQAVKNFAEYKGALKDLGLSGSDKTEEAFKANGIEGLEQMAEQKQAAIDLGFTKADGTVNQAGYEKATSVLGDNPDVIQKYVGFKDDMTRGGYTNQSDYIPKVVDMSGLTPEQKGQFITLYGGFSPTESSMGKKAYDAYRNYGYAGYYYYKALQTLTKDYPSTNHPNGDGKIDTYDRIQQLYAWNVNRDDPDMYNYLSDAKYK